MMFQKSLFTIILSVMMLFGGAPGNSFDGILSEDSLFNEIADYNDIGLSSVEKEYVESLDKITVGWIENSMPLCGWGADGKFDGALQDLCKYLELVFNCEVENQSFSSYELLMEAIENGSVDMAFPIWEELFDDPKGVYATSKSVFTDRLLLIYNGEFDNSIFSTVAVSDDVQMNLIRDLVPDVNLYNCYTREEAFSAVRKKEARSTIGVSSVMTYFMSSNSKFTNLNTMTLNKSVNTVFAFSRNKIVLKDVVNKAIDHMDNNFMIEVMMRHSYVNKESDIGFFIENNSYLFVAAIIFVVTLFTVLFIMYYRSAKKHQAELQAALAEAKRSERAKTEFLSHMSHDIRTPINGIIGMLEMSEKFKDDPEKLAEFREKIKMSSQHLLSLINDVLDMSRISSNRVVLENVPFDIRELVENCKIMVAPLCDEYSISLNEVKYISVDHQILVGSPLHLRQVLVNIVSNAIKYNKEDGWVKLAVSERETSPDTVDLALVVSDNGIGMSEEFQRYMFEPFSREHAGMGTTYTGTGLGMPIVKEIVDKMGGTIEVKSKLGEGSTFIITIPFDISKEEFKRSTEDEVPKDIKGIRALLVEDNELNMEIAEFMLTEAGAIVEKAENGQIAVDMIVDQSASHYDVVLMDMMMPVMDGLAATKAIRALKDPVKSKIPIIAMTANAFTEDQKNCLEAGMNEHLAKPLEAEKVLIAIGKHVKNRHTDL